MDDKTTLNSFKPDKELESFIHEVVAKAIKQRLDPINKDIKNHGEKIDSLVSLYGMINDIVSEVKEKTYPGDIANAIREIKNILIKRGTRTVPTSSDEEIVSTVDLSSIPNRENLDIETINGVTTIKPKIFLGDLWQPIMNAVKTLGGKWIRDGQSSRWEIGGEQPSTSTQRQKPQIKNPNDPASDKQIAFLKQLKVPFNPSLTKGEASRLIDSKLEKK